ncbi:MAG: preprotein translocase subunit SecA [Candidatus Spechtbacterales bacterium]|nr:preprotein translocase subunit SecA [Candidatus Spechtbacterales bacterium]
MSFLNKILGDPNEKEIKKITPIVDQINELEKDVENLNDEELRKKTAEFKVRIEEEGETLDDILPEAYAVVREAAKRTLEQRHYDVQLIGGVVLHQGRIAEMKTGEGKTLASTTAIYLNALSGKGVHVITVNDYLARRDTVWMGQIYSKLGLSVGVITNQSSAHVYDEDYAKERAKKEEETIEEIDEERDELGSFRVEEDFLRPVERKEAYKTDITYGTNNEFGFDYLRDNLVQKAEDKVQRNHNFAIIDEIDSVLIDEARTPLIISAPDDRSTELYQTFSRIVPSLKEDVDYNVDHKTRTVSITEAGIEKVERALDIDNLYDPSEGGGIRYVHSLEQALRANILFIKDKDYVVKEGEVIIVDEFTGRMMPGRRYSEGLHQAIEAKEGVKVKQESRTLASITFQNYFRMYDKLSGMTGTALTSAEEFDRVYELGIVAVPTNKPLVRDDMADVVFSTQKGKYTALVRDIKERNKKGQPILIGTTSIEKNEYLGALLQKEGIEHNLLNAKNHEKEGEIVAQAGRKGAVTVATNMAGRGVDIILGGNPPNPEATEEVKSLGGLHVVGTERHDARRIDNQLRGRAGRQGDPGSSRFYLSLEDEIMRVFGGERVQNIMQSMNVPEDQPLESKMVSKSIESAQSRIEGMHFDSRKRLLEYDEVLNRHRETIYKKRDEALYAEPEEVKKMVRESIRAHFGNMMDHHLASDYPEEWNLEELFEEVQAVTGISDEFHSELEAMIRGDSGNAKSDNLREEVREKILEEVYTEHQKKEDAAGEEAMRTAEKWVLLRSIDILWMDHLDAMNHMRDSVGLRAYAQRDPLVEYKNEGLTMFNTLLDAIESNVVNTLFKINVEHQHSHANTETKNMKISRSGESSNEKIKEVEKKRDIGRNDPCYCGSGKKYKKCHGK